MAARVLLLVPALLLAGCSANSHEGHEEPSLVLTFVSALEAPTPLRWAVVSPASEVVWEGNVTLAPGQDAEGIRPVHGAGTHEVRVDWSGGGGNVTFDPADCSPVTHITLTVAPEGLVETLRECH